MMKKAAKHTLDLVTALVDIFGPATAVRKVVEEAFSSWNQAAYEKYGADELRLRASGSARAFLSRYYEPVRNDAHLVPYRVRIGRILHDTTIYSSRCRVGMAAPLPPPRRGHRAHPDAVRAELTGRVAGCKYPDDLRGLMLRKGAKVAARLKAGGVRLWDQDLYRLIESGFDNRPLTPFFVIDRYITARFTTGLLADELIEALIEHDGDMDILLGNRNMLPIRQRLIPDTRSLGDLSQRLCGGGIGTTFAMARGEPYNDYLIPIQTRSHEVGDNRGLTAVIPQAWHQPVTGDHAEVGLQWTVVREVYEELYGGEEVQNEYASLDFDAYYNKCPGVRFFRDRIGAYEMELLGIGLNTTHGFFESAILLVVHDEGYWEDFHRELKKNWETKNVVQLSTKDPAAIDRIMKSPAWSDEGLFSLTEGLLRLKQMDSTRTELPDLQREVG